MGNSRSGIVRVRVFFAHPQGLRTEKQPDDQRGDIRDRQHRRDHRQIHLILLIIIFLHIVIQFIFVLLLFYYNCWRIICQNVLDVDLSQKLCTNVMYVEIFVAVEIKSKAIKECALHLKAQVENQMERYQMGTAKPVRKERTEKYSI